jgi:hypothetical protein
MVRLIFVSLTLSSFIALAACDKKPASEPTPTTAPTTTPTTAPTPTPTAPPAPAPAAADAASAPAPAPTAAAPADAAATAAAPAAADAAPAAAAPAPAAADAAAATAAAPTGPTVKDTLGSITKVTVRQLDPANPGTTVGFASIVDPKQIEDILAAIGPDQQLGDAQRRCPDALTLSFVSSTNEEKGVLGLCKTAGADGAAQLEGAELAAGGARRSVAIKDPAAFQKLLGKYGR